MSEPEIYVKTADVKAAVQGHEEGILDNLGIDWRRGRPHVDCPYPSHGGKNDWRWDAKKAQAFCTCIEKSDSIFDVVAKVESITFDDAKVRVCEMIGRSDLVKAKGSGKGQKTDPASLLAPPIGLQAPDVPQAYLAFRLGINPTDVLMPNTRAVGWSALPYVEAPAEGSIKFNEVARPPCAVFETVAADGRRHAHRLYTAPEGAGKADLGQTPDGRSRDPKKSASAPKDGPSTSGCSVLWGDPAKAERIVLAEGIETACACAYAYKVEIAAGTVVVAAGIAANGVQAFQPYPATKRITVAADRDEGIKPSRPSPTRAGEKAAREFGLRRHDEGSPIEVRIALPGAVGTSTDWLDVLRADGVAAVRAGIEAAVRFVPTEAELQERADRAGSEAELERVSAMYPVPEMNGRALFYKPSRLGEIWLHKRVQKGKGENADMIDVAVASPFGITARLRMIDADEGYGLRLVVQDMGGRPRPIDIDRRDLATMGGVEVKRLFLQAGVRFEDDGEVVAVHALKAARPETQISIVRHPGWHAIGDARLFVAPGGEIFGLPEEHSLELSVGTVLPASIARGGTLEGWKEAVAAAMTAPGCPHFTLGIAAAFAGVLVDLCGLDSCGINLSGQTSAGKTTAQRLAASAWSVPDSTRPGLFQVAKTTVNGFEALAARANGTVFCLDELAHLTGKETARVIYTLASGIGKARMTAGATMRDPHRWKTFAILSSETSLEAKIRADGENWTGGQAVRIADVDVSDVNRLLDASTFAKIASVSKHFGHAGPAFVRALIGAGTHERASEVKDKVYEGARRLAGPGADAATIRAALPLAILATAGRLAQAFGLLPDNSAVNEAVLWAWAGFKGSSDAVALDPAEQAIGNIRTWIAERWRTSLHGIHAEEKPTRDAVGWWDDKIVYLTPDRLVEAAGGMIKEGVIAKALSDGKMLAKTKSDRNFAIFWVPKVGSLKAYALSRKHFGRGPEADPATSDSFKSYAGGRL